LERSLFDAGYYPFVLDGDNVRHGLCGDLAFSPQDRKENIRRVSEVAGLLADAGIICITSFICPQAQFRSQARRIIGNDRFAEVYVKAPVSLCEQRDPKGLYQRARAGDLPGFTGIDAPYDEPSKPDLVVNTAEVSVEEGVGLMFQFVSDRQIITT
jgi:adenylylsulfate kinase